jgi:GNAT superfamily N-acetyltransferase
VAITSYEAASAFAALHWPAHNREQGISWHTETLGLLATRDGQLVGAATVKVVGGAAQLEQLVVAHGLTRAGIGTALVSAVEVEAQQRGCHVIELETAESQARPFYERLGFSLIGQRLNSKFGQTWYLLEKRL